ncbi:MAG: hypothetical protein OXI01_19020 [Albidovulum sp.]|nr:hypothetical protein [Albidovulum sp.]
MLATCLKPAAVLAFVIAMIAPPQDVPAQNCISHSSRSGGQGTDVRVTNGCSLTMNVECLPGLSRGRTEQARALVEAAGGHAD